jgi:hypothetical protein
MEEKLCAGVEFIGVACNRVTHGAAWGESYVAFAAHNAIALYDVQVRFHATRGSIEVSFQ